MTGEKTAKTKGNFAKPVKQPSVNVKKSDIHGILKEDYPIFCFKYLSGASIENCDSPKFFYNFLMRLQKLSELGWAEIRKSGRHSFGMEAISKENVKPILPSCVSPDIESLHIFRANGNNLPFVGIQIQNVFRVLFIETKFGDIYDH
ncbi:hypothetical protein Barb7_01160 [Bacteroidales bacterium Barb7]|nr:hypothetical protein Barb7_01160 [Bacteroidales bacterium Barb7]